MTLLEGIQTEYDPATDYKAIAERVFNEHKTPEVLDRVRNIIDSMAEPFDHNMAYFEMLNGDFDSMLNYIKSSTDKQLVVDIKNVLGA